MNIKFNLNIFLFLILFLITNQLEIYALIMIFALIHELAHMICGVVLGLKPDTLRIMPFGFSIEFKPNLKDYNKKIAKSNLLSLKKILIALAGPLVNLIIVILGIIFNIDNNIVFSNLLILLFNLIPIYPLDGGRVLKNLFKILLGNKKANRYINTVSNVFLILLTIFSSVFILFFKNVAIFMLIIMLWIIVVKENKRYSTYIKIYKAIDKNYNYL